LSYTSFDYSDIRLSADKFAGNGSITASVTITNTGSVDGTETVQLYIRDLVGSVTRPVKQLKGFRKVNLGPGESKEVSFSIDKETLSFYRADMSFGPESGEFKVFIGGASDNVKEASFSYEE
ncbi:MAG: fibronectin type III-like domain-contianing protein, partial [Bacteroidales bacterium]|nr:fibronectin type III-like domain-contianing protein [Bacteroidales bacterium]